MNYNIITSSYFNVADEATQTPHNLMVELKNALAEVKEAIAGKRELQSAESLLDELQYKSVWQFR